MHILGCLDRPTAGTYLLEGKDGSLLSLDELAAAADSVIARFKREGPSAGEMARTSALKESEFVNVLQSNSQKAEALSDGLVFHGDAKRFERDSETIKGVTAADVLRVANRYLGPIRIMLSTVPMGKRNRAASGSVPVSVAPAGARCPGAGDA